MKKSKYLLGLAFLALGMSMTSCDKENEGAIYNSAFNNVTWEQDEVSTTTAETNLTMPVMITRNHKDGALTVDYTVESSDPEVLSDDCNGKVTFKDGEASTFVNVKATNMEKGETYTYKMKLADDVVADVDTNFNNVNQEVTITIVSDYTWLAAGTCEFVDVNLFGDNVASEDAVPVLNAKEKPELYKILNPWPLVYTAPDDVKYFAESSDIKFTLNADYSAGEMMCHGNDVGGYWIYYNPAHASLGENCWFANDGNVFTCSYVLAQGSSVVYYPAYFQFTWDGWPGAE